MHKQERKSYSLQCYNPDCTCQHYDEDGDEYYEQDPGCLVSGHSHAVSCLSFKPDDPNTLVTAGQTLKIWDLSKSSCLSTLRAQTYDVRAVSWSPGGEWLASGGDDGVINIWDVEKGEVPHPSAP